MAAASGERDRAPCHARRDWRASGLFGAAAGDFSPRELIYFESVGDTLHTESTLVSWKRAMHLAQFFTFIFFS